MFPRAALSGEHHAGPYKCFQIVAHDHESAKIFESPQLPQYWGSKVLWCRPGVVHLLYNEYCSKVHLTHLFVMLHAGPKTNILPHLPLKFTGYKYFFWPWNCMCIIYVSPFPPLKKKVLVTFYFTIQSFFLATASSHLAILTFSSLNCEI